jgi:hypothetical protein
MPERKVIKNEVAIQEAYIEAFGKNHILLKLAEEASELTQICLKLVDKDNLNLPISPDLIGHFWEEMAHLKLFWDMGKKVINHEYLLQDHSTERLNRLQVKLTERKNQHETF